MSPQRRADLSLLAVAAIWGATFVMVRQAVELVGPFTFLAVRFALAGGLLVLLFQRRLRRADRRTWTAGALLGLFLFAGYGFQTAGLQHTTASRAGFLTGLSVVLVPLVAWLWLRRAPGTGPLLGVSLAVVGLALMAWQPGGTLALNRGDWLVVGCAVAFALQIVATARYAPDMDTHALATVEILGAGLLALLATVLFETPVWPLPPTVWWAAAFTGVLATAVAFGVQTAAQAWTTPTHVAVVFATEPVFAAAAGVALAGESMGLATWLGAGLILAGMLVAELWPSRGSGRAKRRDQPPPMRTSSS